MESEISIMYPEIIMYSAIVAGFLLLFWRRRKKFKKGVIVANTKYVKKTGYFKMLNAKYHLYNIIIKVACILIILLYAIVTARLYKTDKHEEEFNNRDIMLCMDFSPSVRDLNKDIIGTMKETVESLKDERFGITVFDSGALTVVPLTTDYNYVLHTLDLMGSYFGIHNTAEYCAKRVGATISGTTVYVESGSMERRYDECMEPKGLQAEYLRSIFTSGINGMSGSSLVGDGLAACASEFKDNDDRTKIIILSTDNMISGKQIVTVPQAAAYAKKKEIKVYPIGTKTIRNKDTYRQGLVDVATTTGGVYYDYADFSVDDINKKIEELNKSSLVKTAYVTKKHLPELIVPYLIYLIPILLILDWRVRI